MDEAKSGKSGKSGNSGKAVWDPFAAEVFLDVCIEQVLARNRHEGYLNQTGYQNLIKNFNERTKRNYVRKQFKNRWETLKKEYSTWKILNQSASCLGRDPITKTIDASDEWWELEIKRCPDAAKFRHAPLANEDKMCQIFYKHCVTNEHARVPLPTSLAGPSQGVPSSVNIDGDDLSGTEIDVQVTPGKYYLVDSGYPNRNGYLAPYKTTRYHVPDFQNHPPRGREEHFNHRHSAGRNSIERCFGILKMKWSMLQGITRRPTDRQKMIITACMCLHNYIRESNLSDQHFDMFDSGPYVLEESASYPSAPLEDDGNYMKGIRNDIAMSIYP